jgi:choline kinase
MRVNHAVVLAAGKGTRLENLFGEKPKCLIELNGKTLLERTLEKLHNVHFTNINIVVGYKKEQVIDHVRNLGYSKVNFVENDYFTDRGSMYSLTKAYSFIKNSTWVFDADLYFDERIFEQISNLDIDSTFLSKHSGSMDETIPIFIQGQFQEFKKVDHNENPEMLGITLLREKTIQLMSEIDALHGYKLSYESALSKAIFQNALPLNLLYIPEYVWSDLDNKNDLARMMKILSEHEN